MLSSFCNTLQYLSSLPFLALRHHLSSSLHPPLRLTHSKMADDGVLSQGPSIRQRHTLEHLLHPSSSSTNGDSSTRSSMADSSSQNRALPSDHLYSTPGVRVSKDLNKCTDSPLDEDGFVALVISALRLAACFVVMLVNATVWGVIMLLLLPWPYARVKQGNLFGHVTGRILMSILGNPFTIKGAEFSKTKAIFISNHASVLDIFIVMRLVPIGTVGIAKKEIIWYPFFGLLFVLANQLRIDRSNPAAAIKSLNKVTEDVIKKDLSLVIFPEGTRSSTGRLLPFKKGFVHLAIRTRRPIVPMILTGTHLSCRKSSLILRPTPLTVTFLPPISTVDWKAEKVDDYVEMLHAMFAEHLPESQKPLPKHLEDERNS